MSNDYQVFTSIAKGLKKPFSGFDISTRIITNKNGQREVSSNPDNYNLMRFDRKFGDDHSFPIATVIPYVREALKLMREKSEVEDKNVKKADEEIKNEPEFYEIKDNKYLKSVKVLSNKENIFEYRSESDRANIDPIIQTVSELMNESYFQIQDQISAVFDKLLINGIELDKNKDTMYIIKEDKLLQITGSIKAKQLKEYLFLLSQQWVRNEKVKKLIKVKLSKNNFTLTYENQKYLLTKTNGEFSEFEKEVINGLKQIMPIA